MKRWTILIYGVVSYLIFLAVFVYAILFVGNLWIVNSLDGEPRLKWSPALGINLLLLGFVAIQHSGMARRGFKRWERLRETDTYQN